MRFGGHVLHCLEAIFSDLVGENRLKICVLDVG
jgi:hypothetical protein